MKIKIMLVLAVLLSAFVFLPDRTVVGTITSPDLRPLKGVLVTGKGSSKSVRTDQFGKYSITVPAYVLHLRFSSRGYETVELQIPDSLVLNATLSPAVVSQAEPVLQQVWPAKSEAIAEYATKRSVNAAPMSIMGYVAQDFNTENYNAVNENGFQIAAQQPVTTFAADVDRAAYSNVRRYISGGHLPPVDAVRIEEMINYFDYNYPEPGASHPVSVSTELTDSPWNPGLKLVHIGLKACKIDNAKQPASNLVFLIDVSGSMMNANKLPLVKQAFKLLADQLRPQDKVSIVTYAGTSGVVLHPTAGSERLKIKEALDELEAGGSTAGSAGIETAYKLAQENMITKGNNRVILATDGDFNVGISSEGGLQRLIEEKRKGGIYLSVLGFGMGNIKDSNMETLADRGNGNYAYIDNIHEARKQFVEEFGGTLFTVAKDVKIQVEFNPAHVQAYRLIGYENRALKNEDFNDDTKDAGDLGSAHTVTALYEIIPAGAKSAYLPKVDALKYQTNNISRTGQTDELLTVKIRYKKPDSEQSSVFESAVKNKSVAFDQCSENLRFAAAVAEYGLLLRKSEFRGNATYQHAAQTAKSALGQDQEGYRAEFVQLVKTTQSIDDRRETARKD